MANTIVRVTPYRYVARGWQTSSLSAFGPDVWFNVPGPLTGNNSVSSGANPNWRDDVRNHRSATTLREITESKLEGGYGQFRVDFKRNTVGGIVDEFTSEEGYHVLPTFQSLPALGTSADNDARMKFFKDAKRAQNTFQGLTALGELRETLHMLRRPAQALRRGLDDYLKNAAKRSRRAKKSSLNRIVAETWLEHVFGWSPLISDVRSAGKALNDRLNRFAGNYARISGHGTQETFIQTAPFGRSVGGGLRFGYRTHVLNVVQVRWYGQIRSVCENPLEADMRLFGVSWGDIIPTAWELIPYSFLADYFTNVGDVISAWSVRKQDIAWCARTERRTSYNTYENFYVDEATAKAYPGFYKLISTTCTVSSCTAKRRYILRQPKTPEYPSLRLEMPGLSVKWINMSALLLARNRTRKQLFR